MMRIKHVERSCGWIAGFLLTSVLLSGCFSRLETTQDGEVQVDVQAISPLPTALATLLPESTPQPSPSPTFYWPPTPLGEIETRIASATVGPLQTAVPTPVITHTIDLAGNLPPENIYVTIVKRANGTYEKYLLPAESLEKAPNFVLARDSYLNLQEKDIVYNGYWLVHLSPRHAPATPSNANESISKP